MDNDKLKSRALALHRQAPLIDLHADTFSSGKETWKFLDGWPERHMDLPRMLETGIWGEAFSLFVHPKWGDGDEKAWLEYASKELDNIHIAIEHSDKFALATNADELLVNRSNGAVSAIIEMEGLHPLCGEIDRIDEFFARGVRIFTLTWNNSNNWATSCMFESEGGIKRAGREAIDRINSLGGIVDFSHSNEQTFYDTIDLLHRPPICTHSCCRAIKYSSRNLTDEQIRAIIHRGGIIGINFFPGFLSSKKYSQTGAEDIVDHIEHILNLGGEGNIGLGSDFDGVKYLPQMDDCTGIVDVTMELLRRNFDRDLILGILGRNFLRIF